MWTIYTFPYRRSGPFIRLLITIKIDSLGKMGNKLSADDREMLDMFRKLSEILRKTKTIDCYIFSRVFHQFAFRINFHKIFLIHPNNVPNILDRQ